MCRVKPDSKQVMTLADVMCSVTKERGVTEVKLVDHSLRDKVKARSQTYLKQVLFFVGISRSFCFQ